MFAIGALFYQEDQNDVPYTGFQKVLITIFTVICVSIFNVILKLLLQTPENPALKDNIGGQIKRKTGFAIGVVYLLIAIYMTNVILAHFSNDIRGTWVVGFIRSFLLDNVINQLVLVSIYFIGALVIIKFQLQEKSAGKFLLKVVNEEVMQLLVVR